MKSVRINTEYIKLDDLLKFAGVLGSGGQAKAVIQDGLVKVDGEVCLMRGKKLRGGEIVEFDDIQIKVINNDN
jgi:ribosome-associated protein